MSQALRAEELDSSCAASCTSAAHANLFVGSAAVLCGRMIFSVPCVKRLPMEVSMHRHGRIVESLLTALIKTMSTSFIQILTLMLIATEMSTLHYMRVVLATAIARAS